MKRRAWIALAASASGVVACGGRHSPSILEPRAPEAHRVAGVWWLMFGLAALVYVIVGAFIVVAILRHRATEGDPGPKDDTFIWAGGIIAPVAILAVLATVTVTTTEALRKPASGELRIEVVGKRWWWAVSYPGTAVTTANEIHVPVGRPVDIGLTSDNVIHSFWVPQLAGKVDTVPGQHNHLRLVASAAGTYRGACAEFCGIQHAHMSFLVVADNPVDFDRWMSRRSAMNGGSPDSEESARGQLVFMRESCAGCHAIKGTLAAGVIGPDLSDFGGRRWIGSITVPNTPDNLTRWIDNSQELKPGSLMPPIQLSAEDLKGVVTYLEGLR